jgi:hypothetical protein
MHHLPAIAGCGDPTCPGWGWFDDDHIERCDACDAFQDDEEAAATLPDSSPFQDGPRVRWALHEPDETYRQACESALRYRQGELERLAADLIVDAQQLEGFIVAGAAPGNPSDFHCYTSAALLTLAQICNLQILLSLDYDTPKG